MEPNYEVTENPPSDAFRKILAPLVAFNEQTVGNANARTLAILLKDGATGEIIGGLWGRSLWDTFYIDMLFVPEALQRKGVGTSILRRAEQEAIRRGCRHIWTDTYAFQARPFYEKFGFIVFGQLDGPAPIFPRFFLQKNLEHSNQ
jgi:GNAT superfamily N-acetyltransferase